RPPNNTSELSAFRSIQAPAQHPFQRPNVHLSAAGEGVFRASAPSPQAKNCTNCRFFLSSVFLLKNRVLAQYSFDKGTNRAMQAST
ncbi:MAG: hypothetical protein NXH94_06190, partial [Rhodobacteraceae bacterium]|nr:hypothetical protein [Paracoccaceae bacterium]